MTELAPEQTPAEAATKLKELTGNADWSKSYLTGDGPKVAEFNRLSKIAAGADKIDLAMAGVLEPKMFQDRSHVDNIETSKLLREGGVDDPAIHRQVLSGEPVSQAEFDAAKSERARLERDHDFQKRYLSGDGAAVRQMTLLNVILTRDVKEAAK